MSLFLQTWSIKCITHVNFSFRHVWQVYYFSEWNHLSTWQLLKSDLHPNFNSCQMTFFILPSPTMCSLQLSLFTWQIHWTLHGNFTVYQMAFSIRHPCQKFQYIAIRGNLNSCLLAFSLDLTCQILAQYYLSSSSSRQMPASFCSIMAIFLFLSIMVQ